MLSFPYNKKGPEKPGPEDEAEQEVSIGFQSIDSSLLITGLIYSVCT